MNLPPLNPQPDGGDQRFWRIRPSHALIVLAGLGGLAIVASTAVLLWDLHGAELARAEREILNLSNTLSEQTARAFQGVDQTVRGTRERLRQGQATGFMVEPQQIHTLFRARIDGLPQVRELSAYDARGRMLITSRVHPAPDVRVDDREFFNVHRTGAEQALYIDQPLMRPIDDTWIVPLSQRMDGADNEFAGIIMAAVDPRYFENVYRSIELGAGSAISLYRRDGTLLAAWPYREELIGRSFADSAVFRAIEESRTPGARQAPLHTDGEAPSLVAFGEVSQFPLVVSVAMNRAAALAGWRRQARLISAGAAGVVMLLMLAAAALRKELMRGEALTAVLRDSEARLNGIIDSAMDAIITADESQRIVLFNPAAEKMFRCTAQDAIGTRLDRFIPEHFRAGHERQVERFGSSDTTSRAMGQQLDIAGLRADGDQFPADISISQVTAAGRKLYTAIVRDVTQRRRTEEELRASHQQLRALSASLQSVREEERTRIARELHDELGQQLAGLKMDLSWITARLPDADGPVAAKAAGMKKLIETTVTSVRRIASELRPLMLDDLGLTAAAEWLAQGFSERTGIAVTLDLDGGDVEPDEALATSAYRILQESLTNVARHAEATQVTVSLKYAGDQLFLKVQDNGKGMAAADTHRIGSFGLIGIRERTLILGGEARIASRPGAGTTVEIVLPLRRAARAGLEEHPT